MNNTCLAKTRPYGWLCPHHLWCWRGWRLACDFIFFHGELLISYFPPLHFFALSESCLLGPLTLLSLKCKTIFSVACTYEPHFSVQNGLLRFYVKPLFQLNLGQLTRPSVAVLSFNSAVLTWAHQQHQSLCQHSINKIAHRL